MESLEDVGSAPLGGSPFGFSNFHFRVNTEEEIVQMKKNREEALNKARESHLVVAALIATVTFAAAFTLPGGYKSDQGTVILAKKATFKVFLISDAISMVLSISAVFIHFFLVQQADDTTEMLFVLATLLTMIGMGTMIIAFITGTFAVLQPVLGLAIIICLIGSSFFFLACGIIYKNFYNFNYWWKIHI